MHKHVSKRVKINRSQWVAQTSMVSISSHGAEKEGYARSNRHHGDASQVVISRQGLI